MKKLFLFDLDNTVVDSSHRTPILDNVDLDLKSYIEMQNKEFIYKDKPLPLMSIMLRLILSGEEVGIVTARKMTKYDYSFLKRFKIKTNIILSRDKIHKIKRNQSLESLKTIYYGSDHEYKRLWFRFLKEKYPLSEYRIYMFDDKDKILTVAKEEGLIAKCAVSINNFLEGEK